MKSVTFCVFASLAIAGVFGASTFDERDDAVREIDAKFKEADAYGHFLLKQIDTEIKKVEPVYEADTKKEAEKLKTSVLQEFADEIKKAARTAVVKGKPLSATECLAKLSLEGRNEILTLQHELDQKVTSVIPNRSDRFTIAIIQTRLTLNAITDLRDQALEKLQDAKNGLQSIKTDALKKIESGKKQLTTLEVNIHKPSLPEEYVALKNEITKKFNELKDVLFKKAQKCIF